MKYTFVKGLKISKLSLGTAQLGYNYGIANTIGKPGLEQSLDILKTAVNAGINCFDTALSYGDSEEVIGSFISTKINRDTPIIITKLKPLGFNNKTNPVEIYNEVKNNVLTSMQRLKIKRIPFYLLHKASNMVENDGLIVHSLAQLKDEELIEKIGVSVYSPEEVEKAIDIGEFDAIQIPINIFDHRLIRTGLLNNLKQHNFIVFARSVFLQGLFFLNSTDLPNNLKLASTPIEILRKISEEYKIGVDELAFTFVRDLPGISSAVIGAETSAQVQRNCSLVDYPKLSKELTREIFESFSDLPVKILNPALWNI